MNVGKQQLCENFKVIGFLWTTINEQYLGENDTHGMMDRGLTVLAA